MAVTKINEWMKKLTSKRRVSLCTVDNMHRDMLIMNTYNQSIIQKTLRLYRAIEKKQNYYEAVNPIRMHLLRALETYALKLLKKIALMTGKLGKFYKPAVKNQKGGWQTTQAHDHDHDHAQNDNQHSSKPSNSIDNLSDRSYDYDDKYLRNLQI